MSMQQITVDNKYTKREKCYKRENTQVHIRSHF